MKKSDMFIVVATWCNGKVALISLGIPAESYIYIRDNRGYTENVDPIRV